MRWQHLFRLIPTLIAWGLWTTSRFVSLPSFYNDTCINKIMMKRFLTQTLYVNWGLQEKPSFHHSENFNFVWCHGCIRLKEKPDKLALLWTNIEGECIRYFQRIWKEQSIDGILLPVSRNRKVIWSCSFSNTRYEFWLAMMALLKLRP